MKNFFFVLVIATVAFGIVDTAQMLTADQARIELFGTKG